MEKDFKNLNDEEIKSLILESHERQLELFFKMAQTQIIMLYEEIKEMAEEKNIYDFIEDPKEKEILLNSYNNLIKLFNRINLDMNKEEIEEEIKNLLNIRKGLENLFAVINAYNVEMTYVSELTNYYMMRFAANKNYKNGKVDNEEIKNIVDLISAKLAERKSNYTDFSLLVSQVLGILPFRMTKTKFYNVLEATLKRNLNNHSISYVENAIIDYKLTFDSSYMGDYGILFDHYFMEIQYYKNINFKNKSYEELENIMPKSTHLWETINNINDLIGVLGIFTNKLIAIYLIKNRIQVDLSNNDIFNIWIEYIENPKEKSLEELIARCNLELKDIEASFHEEEALMVQAEQEIGVLYEELDNMLREKIMKDMDIVKYIGDNNFNKYEVLFPKNEEIITEDYLNQLIDSLIRYINRSISNMGSMERKIRMRRLLTHIAFPFEGFEEFVEYIYYSLDERVVSKEEILFTIDAIYFMLKDEPSEEE
jgi:hypothetical protein